MATRRLLFLTLTIAMTLGTGSIAVAVDENDAWGQVPTPNASPDQNELAGISASSPDDIWAVGRFNSGRPPTVSGRDTLALRWNGSAWQITPTPNPTWPGADLFTLEDVESLAADNAWAVGYASDFGSFKSTTLIEHWNGASWQIARSPNPTRNGPNQLNAIDAAASNDIWAVGGTGFFPARSLILRFNGSRWRVVANSCGVPLSGVDVVTPTEVWAVGVQTICRFNGSSWSVVPTPPPDPGSSEMGINLFDVSGASPDAAWAVGNRAFQAGEHVSHSALILRWDGTSWTRIIQIPGQTLFGVVALAPDDAWAVGTDGIGGVVLHWDGVDWTRVPSPPESGHIADVVPAGAKLWAAGTAQSKTLTLQSPSDLEGTVVGHTNVGFAVVSWFGPESGSTETDPFGDYTVPGLLAGNYFFTVGNPGCEPASGNVTVVAGETIRRDFTLNC